LGEFADRSLPHRAHHIHHRFSSGGGCVGTLVDELSERLGRVRARICAISAREVRAFPVHDITSVSSP
jgi:hypothetical protein